MQCWWRNGQRRGPRNRLLNMNQKQAPKHERATARPQEQAPKHERETVRPQEQAPKHERAPARPQEQAPKHERATARPQEQAPKHEASVHERSACQSRAENRLWMIQTAHHHYIKIGRYQSEVAQSCPTLCAPVDCSPPGSSVHGIFQAGILEWVSIPFSRGPSRPRDWTQVSLIVSRHFTVWATREAQ